MSSAAFLVLAKAMVLTPCETRFAKTRAPSVRRLRLSPFSLSSKGGLRKMTRRSPVEAPSLSTRVKGRPVRLSASSCGLAIVALVSTKRGSPPCNSATRLSRLSTAATCDPKTPRKTCASSTATISRLRRKSAQASWLGRMPMFSMSGLVSRMFDLRQSLRRVEEDSAALRPAQRILEGWDLVAQRFPARRRRRHDDVLTGQHPLVSFQLVRVQPRSAHLTQRLRELRPEVGELY